MSQQPGVELDRGQTSEDMQLHTVRALLREQLAMQGEVARLAPHGTFV